MPVWQFSSNLQRVLEYQVLFILYLNSLLVCENCLPCLRSCTPTKGKGKERRVPMYYEQGSECHVPVQLSLTDSRRVGKSWSYPTFK